MITSNSLRYPDRFTERLRASGFSEHQPIPLDLYGFALADLEIWDKIDRRVIPHNLFKEVSQSRARELEAAIRRFVDCGVELSRFSVEEHPGETRLCVDGVPRFVWRLVHA